ncbi:hypothetical protein FGB62_292g017 [Gracilaria domingensis]|nr:hypothetical protein FGB62_292g017 [Gracilaria domingensis]
MPAFGTLFNRTFAFACHNMSGVVIDYYYAEIFESEMQNLVQYSSRGENSGVYEVTVGPLTDVSLLKLTTLEFRDQVLMTAEHLANEGSSFSSPSSLVALHGSIRRLMYTRMNNLTVSVPGDEVSERTVVDEMTIIIGVVEVAAIVVLGLVIELFFKYRWKHIQSPNTVDGLSECWARSIAGAEQSEGNGEKVIILRLRKTNSDGIERVLLEPVMTRNG